MVIDANVIAFLGYCLLLLLWIALPLLPAWLTYKITPDQKLGLTGPLQGLTVRASGAFGAYLVIFLTLALAISRGEGLLGNITTAMWTLKADVVTIDRNGVPARPRTFGALSVSFHPDLHTIGKSNVTLKLPGNSEEWPLLLLQIPNYGGAEVNLSDMNLRFKKDEFKKSIELREPIVIREFPADSLGIGKQYE